MPYRFKGGDPSRKESWEEVGARIPQHEGSKREEPDYTWTPRQPVIPPNDNTQIQAPRRPDATGDKMPNLFGGNTPFRSDDQRRLRQFLELLLGIGKPI